MSLARFGALAVALLVSAAACADGATTVEIPTPTGTIAGRVLDTQTGAGLAGVNIAVQPFVPGVTTDAEGRFVIENLVIETEYRVTAVKPGYTSSSVDVDVSRSQLFTSVEFTLLRIGP